MSEEHSVHYKPERLVSLDAYRGFIMVLMASVGFGAAGISTHFPDSGMWRFLGFHCDHVEWAGCAFWDLIQPAFMFMVGVALPFSVANRKARGEGAGRTFAHAVWRGALLVLLAIFLQSKGRTDWTFPNVLAQIGLGYPILYLVALTGPRTTWAIAGVILIGYWLAFAVHPIPPADFDWAAVGVPPDWPHFSGFAAHWDKSANLAASFDVWFLNLFPRAEQYEFNRGGYQTLNFIPSIATMIFGLCAGRLLRGELSMPSKLMRLVLFGVSGVVIGYLIDLLGICPVVKRIWTPSWAIYSAGWVTLILAGFVAVVDWVGWKSWAFPLVVVGLSPITLYCVWQLGGGFIREQFRIHFGRDVFTAFGEIWVPALERGTVLAVLWLLVWWMYRRRIFIRI